MQVFAEKTAQSSSVLSDKFLDQICWGCFSNCFQNNQIDLDLKLIPLTVNSFQERCAQLHLRVHTELPELCICVNQSQKHMPPATATII